MNCYKCNRVLDLNGFMRINDEPHCKRCSLIDLNEDMTSFVDERLELIRLMKSEPCFEKSGKPVILSLHKCIQCIKYILDKQEDKLQETLKFITMVSVRAEEHLFDEEHRERLYKGIVEGLLSQIKTINNFNKYYKLIQNCSN